MATSSSSVLAPRLSDVEIMPAGVRVVSAESVKPVKVVPAVVIDPLAVIVAAPSVAGEVEVTPPAVGDAPAS